MSAATRGAATAGAVGALTTTLLHEITRRLLPDAPRVDLLGMQALARGVQAAGFAPPGGRPLYALTLAGDLASNTAYFSLVGASPRGKAVVVGLALGVAAGLGAVYLPPYMGLNADLTTRTPTTTVLTTALYTAGGIAAGLVYQGLPDHPPTA